MCDSPTLLALRKLADGRLYHIADRAAEIAGNDRDKLRSDVAASLAAYASQVIQERLEARLLAEISSERNEALALAQSYAASL